MPYSDINSDVFIQLVGALENLENLDVTGCFNLCVAGYRQFKLIKKLKFLSIGFLPVSYNELAPLVNVEFLGVSKCMVYKLELLKLILNLTGLKRVAVLSTISYTGIDVKIKTYFEKELDGFVETFKILGRNVTIYYDDSFDKYCEKLGSVIGVNLYRMFGFTICPRWYTEETAYGLWLLLNRGVIDVIRNMHT